jgi:glycosyltransferase involved in cell wall biosynthesis
MFGNLKTEAELRSMPSKLSVITPVFNGIRFIEFCIRNMIDQKCPEAEHIIVDGGSTDGTVDVIRRYATDYPHIRWESKPDKGQSDAMNKGLAMAAGEIVGFLNVDDFYEPGAIREALDLIKDLPEPTLLVGNCNILEEGDRLQGVGRPDRIGLLQLLCANVARSFPLNPTSYFYHKSLHDRIGHYEVDEHYGMDVHFIVRAVQSAHVTYVDRVWGNLRYISGTKTYEDVESGENRIRVGMILQQYRRQAPIHYRIFATFYVGLVKMYKWCEKLLRKSR